MPENRQRRVHSKATSAPPVHPADLAAQKVLDARAIRAWSKNPPLPGDRLPTMWAIDPGDVHCGMAEFQKDDTGWQCVKAWESPPDQCADLVANRLLFGLLDVLIVESFRLYGDKAKAQTGSEFPTAQLIGVLKYLIRVNNRFVDTRASEPDEAARQIHVPIVMQPADIKNPTFGVLRSRGIKSEASRSSAGGHAKDAECHGWYYIIHDLEEA